MYFICTTDLIATFRDLYPELDYEGNRAILLDVRGKFPEDALAPLHFAGADLPVAKGIFKGAVGVGRPARLPGRNARRGCRGRGGPI